MGNGTKVCQWRPQTIPQKQTWKTIKQLREAYFCKCKHKISPVVKEKSAETFLKENRVHINYFLLKTLEILSVTLHKLTIYPHGTNNFLSVIHILLQVQAKTCTIFKQY